MLLGTCKLCPVPLPTTTPVELRPAVVVTLRTAYACKSPVTQTDKKNERERELNECELVWQEVGLEIFRRKR